MWRAPVSEFSVEEEMLRTFFPPTFNDQDQIYKMIYRVLQSKKNEYLENVIIYTSAKMFQFWVKS